MSIINAFTEAEGGGGWYIGRVPFPVSVAYTDHKQHLWAQYIHFLLLNLYVFS